jgi:hypothetical protein
MDAAGLDVGADADAFKISANVSTLRSNKKHFGNASSHFSVATAAAKENQLRNRVTANINNNDRKSRANSASHGRNANLSPLR